MGEGRIRILFADWVDAHNFNAQSLNAREIVLRLNPEVFHSTLFYEKTPDPRLLGRPSITLFRVPPRFGTFRMLFESFRGYDLIFRASLSRFIYLYLRISGKFRCRTEIIHWLEGYQPAGKAHLAPHQLKYLNLIHQRIKHWVGITEFIARKHLEEYGLRSREIIPVGVDTKVFTPPFPHRSNAVPVVLSIGHFIPRKRPQAVFVAARFFPNVRFVLVGAKRGSFHLHLNKMLVNWKLSNVTLLDPMPQNRLAQLMQQSDILLHPSRCEGFPKVVLESAATGLPAIIFKDYEAPAVVDGVTGFQVRTHQEMLARLGQLINEAPRRRRMGEAAAEYAKTFHWDRLVKQWEEVFENVRSRREASGMALN